MRHDSAKLVAVEQNRGLVFTVPATTVKSLLTDSKNRHAVKSAFYADAALKRKQEIREQGGENEPDEERNLATSYINVNRKPSVRSLEERRDDHGKTVLVREFTLSLIADDEVFYLHQHEIASLLFD